MRKKNELTRVGRTATRGSGFTLVELLVVIGIISVLVALLLPVLRGAREQARMVQDLSSIRQCAAVAIGMYALDNQGTLMPLIGVRAGFPIAGYLDYRSTGAIGFFSTPSYNAFFFDFLQMYLQPHNQRDSATWSGEYSGVLYCAADEVWTPGSTKLGWRAGPFREPSWRMNYAITPCLPNGLPNQAFPERYWKVGGVRRASDKILFVEHHYECSSGAAWGFLNAQAVDPPFSTGGVLNEVHSDVYPSSGHISMPRHKRGFVAAFCDGSAKVIPFGARQALVNDPATGNHARDGEGPNWALGR